MRYLGNNVQSTLCWKRWRIIVAVILLFVIFGASGCCGFINNTHLSSFKGRVIDTDTKKPIEGAVVLAIYYKTGQSIAGTHSSVAHGRETLTDAKGEFEILAKCERLYSVKGWPSARLEIFKPGYGTLWHQQAKAVGENKSWPPSGKHVVYELPRLKTKKEIVRNLPSSYSDIPYNNKKQYIKLINIERKALGAKTFFSEPKKEQ